MKLREQIESIGCKVINEDENKIVVSCPIDIASPQEFRIDISKIAIKNKEIILLIEKNKGGGLKWQ